MSLRQFGYDLPPSDAGCTFSKVVAKDGLTLAILAAAASAIAMIIAWWLDFDLAAAVSLLGLLAAVALALDVRRRARLLHRVILESHAKLESKIDGGYSALDESIHELDEAFASARDAILDDHSRTRDLIQLEAQGFAARAEHASEEATRTTAEAMMAISSETTRSIASVATDLRLKIPSSTRARVAKDLMTTYRQIEALIGLHDLVAVKGPTPPLREWAASADVIHFLVTELRRLQPSTVVECGSGASTVWLALAARTFGLDCRIVALENDPHYAHQTRRALDECEVGGRAEVLVAPLESLESGDFTGVWYDTDALDSLSEVGLLFVDGPPASTGPLARYPALPLLYDRLSSDATVVLDDTIRDEEADIASAWAERYPEFARADFKFEKGACVLRRTSSV